MRTDAACAQPHSRASRHQLGSGFRKGFDMLSTLVVVLLVLWLLGVTTAYTLGGLIHVLLAIAIITFLLRVIQGRNPLAG